VKLVERGLSPAALEVESYSVKARLTSMKPGKLLLISHILALGYVLASWTLTYCLSGIVRRPNSEVLLLYGNVGCASAIVAFAILFALTDGRHVIRARSYKFLLIVAAVVPLCLAPFLAWKTRQVVQRASEIRDLRRFGVGTLRSEAAILIQASKEKPYEPRWFGLEVPTQDLLPTIRAAAVGAAYVTADNDGVVLVMDGLGGWRGGYMITPHGSKFVPKNSRAITEGVFYFTAW
jgi:hypothetical protein